MAAVAKSGTPSLSTVVPCSAHRVASGLLAGEAIAAGDACYIKGSDNKVYKSDGTAANAAATVDGWAAIAAAIGEAVTLFTDVEFRYGAAMVAGTKLYLATVPGTLVDIATIGGVSPIGRVVDATRIRVWQSRY